MSYRFVVWDTESERRYIFPATSDKGTFQPAQLKCDLVARIPVKKVSTTRLSYLLGYSLYCLPNEHHEESLI